MDAHARETYTDQIEALRGAWDAVMAALVKARAERAEPVADPPRFLEEATAHASRERALIIVAPTGVGKTTIGRGLEAAGFGREARVTTRPMRPGEAEGRDYEFVSEAEFDRLLAAGALFHVSAPTPEEVQAQRAEGHRAAVRLATVERLRGGARAYLEGGPATARELKARLREAGIAAQLVVLLPPSFDAWRIRLEGRVAAERAAASAEGSPRRTLTDEQIVGRMQRGLELLREAGPYADRFIVNDTVERAVRLLTDVPL